MNNKKKFMTKINFVLFVILSIVCVYKFYSYDANASGTWRGYAVYRDGVVMNLNDHAALMDEDTINTAQPVIHAVGYNGNVKFGTWAEFLDGENYIGLFKPKNCTISSALADSFKSKARELRGISYTVLDQIDYDAGTNTWVRPEHIYDLRCDGVVEYTYEWFGYRVGGADGVWDITRNLSDNYIEHTGFSITPRKQNEDLLYLVTTASPY